MVFTLRIRYQVHLGSLQLLYPSDYKFFLPTLSGLSPQSNTMTGLMTSPVCLRGSRPTEFFQLGAAPSCISDSHGMYGLIELGQLVKPGHLVYRKLALVVHGDQTGKGLRRRATNSNISSSMSVKWTRKESIAISRGEGLERCSRCWDHHSPSKSPNRFFPK
jgi:hypothetical protein